MILLIDRRVIFLVMEEWRLEVIRDIEGLEKERRGIFKRIERINQGTITKHSGW